MTQLELVAELGNGTLEIVRMYFNGRLTAKELGSVLGKKKAAAVEKYLESDKI